MKRTSLVVLITALGSMACATAWAGTCGCTECVVDPCNLQNGCPGNCGMSPPTCQTGGCPASPSCAPGDCPTGQLLCSGCNPVGCSGNCGGAGCSGLLCLCSGSAACACGKQGCPPCVQHCPEAGNYCAQPGLWELSCNECCQAYGCVEGCAEGDCECQFVGGGGGPCTPGYNCIWGDLGCDTGGNQPCMGSLPCDGCPPECAGCWQEDIAHQHLCWCKEGNTCSCS